MDLKRIILLVGMIIFCGGINRETQLLFPSGSGEIPGRKKIVIFMLKGGYGHQAASNALCELLSPAYEVKAINIFEQLGIGGLISGEELYNKALSGGWIRSLNFAAAYIAPPMMNFNAPFYKKRIRKILFQEDPDFVISVAPYLYRPIIEAAKSLNIPSLLVTTDGDVTNWTVGLDRLRDKNIAVTIGFENAKTRPLFNAAGIDDHNIFCTGFPIRKDFFEQKNIASIKKTWGMPINAFTVMILMGGVGADITYRYVKKIQKMNLPIHMVVCAGRNEKMYKKLKKLQKKTNCLMTVVSFTPRISDLMSASDLLITKAGPGSINEAMNMNLPMLIDRTSKLLSWEKANIHFVERNNFGQAVKSFKQLKLLLKMYIEDKTFYQVIKQNLVDYEKQDFDTSILRLVSSLCPVQTYLN